MFLRDHRPHPVPPDPTGRSGCSRAEKVAESAVAALAVSVPEAALLLAQGSGRLIRTPSDRGVVAVLDPRLMTAGYGSLLTVTSPMWLTTTDAGVARAALQRHSGAGLAGQLIAVA